MKAIIDGIRYNTERAKHIGEGGNLGLVSRSDFHFWCAGLYRAPRSGRYFLAGEGGAMTQFGHGNTCQGGRTGGDKIIPLTEAEAFEWAQRELDTAAVEEFFSHMIKDA